MEDSLNDQSLEGGEVDRQKFKQLEEEYRNYKNKFANNIAFDPTRNNLGKISRSYNLSPFLFRVIEGAKVAVYPDIFRHSDL